jgi:uncharacterized membrane protein
MPKLKKPRETTPSPAASRPDWIVAGLALVGLAVAGYLTALKLGGNQAFLCRDGSGCDIVQASRYSLLAGVPTALWGAAVYAAIFVLSAIPQTVRRWQAAFMLTSAAVAFSIYLTYLSIFVIGATCPYCLGSGAISLLLLVTMLVRRPVAQGRAAQAYSLKRLAGLGITAGGVAVLFGAFIFAADFSTPADYQMALAEHLKKNQAIFYGAYW